MAGHQRRPPVLDLGWRLLSLNIFRLEIRGSCFEDFPLKTRRNGMAEAAPNRMPASQRMSF